MYTVRTIRECAGRNPEYCEAAHRAAQEAGETYDVPRDIIHPIGTEFTDRRAYVLCLISAGNTPPVAVPVCERAKAKVRERHERHVHRLAAMKARLRTLLSQMKKDKDGKPKPRNQEEDCFLETCEAYGYYDSATGKVLDPPPPKLPEPPAASKKRAGTRKNAA